MKNLIECFKTLDESNKPEKDHKHTYGCVMLTLDDTEIFARLRDSIEDGDLYNPDGTYGLEHEPHVTVLFGLCDEILIPSDVVKVLEDFTAPEVAMTKLDFFSGKEFDVLKINIDSLELAKMHNRLRQFPHVDTFPDYRPHVTIAYMKKGRAAKYVTADEFIGYTTYPTRGKYGLTEGGDIRFTLKEKE